MSARNIDFKFLGDEAAKKDAVKNAPGPDLTLMACACGEFGPWGDGTARYCREHVPPQLRFAAQFFAEMVEE